MGVKVTVDMSGAGKKLDKLAKNDALGQYLAMQGMKYMNDHFVPKLSGALRGSAVARPFKIIWGAPYAHKQWTGDGISKRSTPGTISHWEEPKVVSEYIAREATNWARTH